MTLSVSLVSFLAEINGLLLLAVAAMLIVHVRSGRRGTREVSALVKAIKESEPAQVAALQAQLKEQYGQADEEAAENAKRLVKQKKAFYRQLVTAFLRRDAGGLGALDQPLDELLMSYRQLMPVTVQAPPPAAAAAPADHAAVTGMLTEKTDSMSAAIDEIKRQNETLRKELEDTKQALQSTLSEYVSAYSGGHVDEQSVDTEFHKLHDGKAPPSAPPKGGVPDADGEPPSAAAGGRETPPTAGYEVVEQPAQDEGGGDDSEDIMALSDALVDIGLDSDEAAAISKAGADEPPPVS